tara:strand:- start:107 stop:550 length:444 start_codon:yes stop_codon:yes gene_type:complete
VIYDYRAQEQVRKLTLKLKNAIMIYWLKVKEARKKPSFEDIIKNLQKKKREEQNNVGAFKEARKRQRKEKREKLKQEALERQQEAEAHLTSYINKDQFNVLYESILDINTKIQEHSEIVDEIEIKLQEVNRRRKNRRDFQKPEVEKL